MVFFSPRTLTRGIDSSHLATGNSVMKNVISGMFIDFNHNFWFFPGRSEGHSVLEMHSLLGITSGSAKGGEQKPCTRIVFKQWSSDEDSAASVWTIFKQNPSQLTQLQQRLRLQTWTWSWSCVRQQTWDQKRKGTNVVKGSLETMSSCREEGLAK